MPQHMSRSRKKAASSGVSKVAGYAYTRKYQELQELVERLQQHARVANQHVEALKQREMVLLDLTLHQEQIIALFNHNVLMGTCQQHQQHGAPQDSGTAAEQQAPDPGADSRLATAAAALHSEMGLSQLQAQAQPQQQFSLQGLHAQLLQQVKQARVQQQQLQQRFDQSTQPTLLGQSTCDTQEKQQHPQQQWSIKQEQLLDQPSHAAAAAGSPMQADQLPEQHQQQQHMQIDTTGYVGSVLQAAAADPAQQQRVLTMTAADWSKFFTESFYKLLLLLELSDRGDVIPCEHMMQQMALAGHGPGGSTAAGFALGSTIGDTTYNRSSQPVSHTQQLEQLVDEWVMLSALALILNPLPVYMATTINHATQVTCAVPPGHFDRVVRRMRLTKQQVRHFAAVLEEIVRLDDAVMAQGGQLARNAACPSTVVLAAEAERGAGHAAAAVAAAAATPRPPPAAVPTKTAAAATEEQDMHATPDAGIAAAAGAAVAGVLAGGVSCVVADTAAAVDCLQDSSLQENAGETAEETPGGTPSEDEGLAPLPAENLLQRNVGRLPLHALLLLMFNCSTLTKLQLAKCIVASYPFVPMTGAIAASAARLWYQHAEQQQQRQQDDKAQQQTAMQAHLRRDEADELCCQGEDALPEALHKQQLQVLQQRRKLLDQQLQQWWQEWSGLKLGN